MTDTNAAGIEGQPDALALLAEFIRCDDDDTGLYDCHDNHGVAYQSAHMAGLLKRARDFLAFTPPAGQVAEGSAALAARLRAMVSDDGRSICFGVTTTAQMGADILEAATLLSAPAPVGVGK